jgi:hypothetical protein
MSKVESNKYGIAIRNKIPLLRAKADSLLFAVEVEAVALHIAHWASTNEGDIIIITRMIKKPM